MKFSKQTQITKIAIYSYTELVEAKDGDVKQLVKHYIGREHSTDVIARWHYEYQIAQSYSLNCLLTPIKLVDAPSDLAIYFEYSSGRTLRSLTN